VLDKEKKLIDIRLDPAPGKIIMGKCDQIVEFHGKSKAIKDIFPEECQAQTVDQKVLDPTNPCGLGSPATEDKAKVAECMKQLLGEVQKPELSGIDGLHGGGSDRGILIGDSGDSEPVPPDVPAIQKPAEGITMPLWRCADKSRILLTAEDGKKWCHKVQP
jgi:hypothetical protein